MQYLFLNDSLMNIKFEKVQHLFEMDMFYNIFTVSFDHFNSFLWNKMIN